MSLGQMPVSGPISGEGSKVEVAISQCPGDMNEYWLTQQRSYNGTQYYPCYVEGSGGSQILQVSHSFGEASFPASLNYCFTRPEQGPWYVNVRYTYESCPYQECGYSVQWNAANPPLVNPSGEGRRTDWPPSTVVLDPITIGGHPLRIPRAQHGVEYVFAYEVSPGTSWYKVEVAEMPGTLGGFHHITAYSPDGYIIGGPQRGIPHFSSLQIINPAPGLHHIVVVAEGWDTVLDGDVSAFILQVRRGSQ